MNVWDAIIVGAGPAGSATARHLAHSGLQVLLLDRAAFPRDKACSEYLSPEVTRLLARLGSDVLGAVERAAPARLRGMKVFAPNGAVMCGRFDGRHPYPAPRPYSFALPRMTFDAILVESAIGAGVELRERVAVDELTFDASGMVNGVATRDAKGGKREALRAGLVIGADGLNSTVARKLGLARRGVPHRIAFTAHVRDVAGVKDFGELHVSRTGYVGLGPIGDGVTTVALVLPVHAARRTTAGDPHGFVTELDRFPGLGGRFDPARFTREVLVTGPFARWSRSSVAPHGGALLVGDAADFFDPFTGQGIYSALKGAELVAETVVPLLSSGRRPGANALARYRSLRRHTFSGKWILERLIGLGVGSPAITNRVVSRLARSPERSDLLVGATGNFVPARVTFTPRFLAGLIV